MPTPTVIADLSTTIASNFPSGSNAPSVLDDVQRAHAAFIAQLRDRTATDWPNTPTGGVTETTVQGAVNGLEARKAKSGANSDITSLTALAVGGLPNAVITQATMATAVLPLGVGQTWQNMIASRAPNVIYTNNTGRPIFAQADLYSTAGCLLTLYVYPGGSIPGGVEVDVTQMAAGVSGSVGGIIPNGDTYQVAQSAGTPTLYRWAELR